MTDKFNEFSVNMVSMVYDFEAKEEEKQSLYSSAMLNPSHINVRIGDGSGMNSARQDRLNAPIAFPGSSVVNQNVSMTIHKSNHSPGSQQFQFFKKNPLLPPSPSSRDPNFVLKGKIRDLIHHTEQLYQKMVMEKSKIDKK